MIAALAVQPHKRPDDRKTVYGYVDFGLILCWWLYLYVFAVIPWQYVAADSKQYVQAFSAISLLQNLVFVGGAAYLFRQATGYWRRIYAQSCGCQGHLRHSIVGDSAGSRTGHLFEGQFVRSAAADFVSLAGHGWESSRTGIAKRGNEFAVAVPARTVGR